MAIYSVNGILGSILLLTYKECYICLWADRAATHRPIQNQLQLFCKPANSDQNAHTHTSLPVIYNFGPIFPEGHFNPLKRSGMR